MPKPSADTVAPERPIEVLARRVGPLVINGVGALATIIGGLLIARELGVRAFGLYSTGLVASRFASAAGQVGLGQVVVRLMSNQSLTEEDRNRQLWTALTMVVAGVALAGILLAALAAPLLAAILESPGEVGFPGFVRRVVYIFAATVPLHGVTVVIGQLWTGRGHASWSMAIQTAAQPVALLALLVIAPFGWGSTAQTTAVLTLLSAGVALGFAVATLPFAGIGRWRLDRAAVPSLAHEGALLMPSALVQLGGLTFAVILLGAIASVEAAGVYAIAARTVVPVSIVVAALAAQVARPLGNALSSARDEAAAQTAVKWARAMLAVALPYAVAMFILAEPILEWVIDADARAAAGPTRFLLVGGIASICFGPVLLTLTLIGAGRAVNQAVVGGLVVGMVGMWVFGSKYGASGAAAASMVQVVVTNVVASHKLRQLRGIGTGVIHRPLGKRLANGTRR